jgi:hypothetical protein
LRPRDPTVGANINLDHTKQNNFTLFEISIF